MRTVTALFGHSGFELDLTLCTDAELAALTAWASLYKEVRGLLHSGDVVRADHPDPGAWLHGVVAPDRREALFSYVRLETSAQENQGRLVFPAWTTTWSTTWSAATTPARPPPSPGHPRRGGSAAARRRGARCWAGSACPPRGSTPPRPS
jgi:alpha-galactosidase